MKPLKKFWILLSVAVLLASLRYDELWASFFYHPSAWAQAMETYGQIPSLGLGLFLITIQATQVQSFTAKLGWTYSAILVALGLGYHYGPLFNLTILEGMMLSIALWALVNVSVKKLDVKDYTTWIGFAVWTFMGAALFPQILKILWARPRYTEVLSGAEPFVSWLMIPRGLTFEDRLMSFPSGHSAITASLLSLMYFPFQSSTKRPIVQVLVSAYTLLMMISRLTLGQHYVSDVLVGFGCVWLWMQFLRRKV